MGLICFWIWSDRIPTGISASKRENQSRVMKTFFVASIGLLLFNLVTFSQNTSPGGIVYGPKAAFKIDAPAGWVLDNQSGVEQGLPCVLYPKGESWTKASTVMYAKIAGTQFEDVEKFVATAIKEMKD